MRTWVKLYTEILRDPKMHGLSDHRFRACVNLIALAGQLDENGRLGTAEDVAFHLRIEAEEATSLLEELSKIRVTCNKNGIWRLKNWTKRNGKPLSDTRQAVRERVKKYRENKPIPEEVKRQGNADVTPLPVEHVTPGNAPRLDKNRGEEIREEKKRIDIPAGEQTPAKPAAIPLTVGQQKFLEALGAKKFKTTIQRDAVLKLETTYGTDKLQECVVWASKRGMGVGQAIGAIETAIKTWGAHKNTNGNGAGPPRNKSQDALEEFGRLHRDEH